MSHEDFVFCSISKEMFYNSLSFETAFTDSSYFGGVIDTAHFQVIQMCGIGDIEDTS